MGAPGIAFLCGKGHLYHWIEDDLWWGSPGIEELTTEDEISQAKAEGTYIEVGTVSRGGRRIPDLRGKFVNVPNEALEAEVKRARQGCPCGDKTVYEIPHYGDINDCICLPEEVAEKGILRINKETLRVHIPDATDFSGNPIEAYRDVRFDVYDISRISPEYRILRREAQSRPRGG